VGIDFIDPRCRPSPTGLRVRRALPEHRAWPAHTPADADSSRSRIRPML